MIYGLRTGNEMDSGFRLQSAGRARVNVATCKWNLPHLALQVSFVPSGKVSRKAHSCDLPGQKSEKQADESREPLVFNLLAGSLLCFVLSGLRFARGVPAEPRSRAVQAGWSNRLACQTMPGIIIIFQHQISTRESNF